MKITESEDEIILRNTPFGFWMLGVFGFFIFGGCFVLTIIYTIFNPREMLKSDDGSLFGLAVSVFVFVLFVAFAGAMTAIFVGLILSPVITTKINRNLKTVEISRRNLIKKNLKTFDFSTVQRFGSQRRRVKSGFIYYVALLTNDSWIEIEDKGRSKSEAVRIADKLNSFIKLSK